jgi:predicted amidophosphoribosyltransferase
MTWNARLCRECRDRFVPLRADQQVCGPCAAQSDELHALLSYLRAHPEDPLTRVSVATGVSEQSITQLARAGLLPVVPAGAEASPSCTCEGGSRCPVCKAEVAKRIVRAVDSSRSLSDVKMLERARATGMGSRHLRSR